jgi:hypothetical protein
MSLNVLMVSDTMIKERTVIHGNIDPKLIYPDIKVAQDMYIKPLLGSALFDKLQAIISDGTITDAPNVNYKLLMDKYIVDALIYYTLSDLPTTLSYQFWNKGMVRKQGDNTTLPSMSELIDISNKYKQRAEFYTNACRLYLRQNAATMYLEYLNPGKGVDTTRPEQKSYTMPIYLGSECDHYRTYEEKYQGNRPNCCD